MSSSRPVPGSSLLPGPGLVLVSLFPLALLVLPLFALLWRSGQAHSIASVLATPMVREAFWLSLWTSLVSLLVSVLLGTPLAYLLARYQFAGKELLDTLLDIPIVLPPAVAGVGLLVTFGRQGILGGALTAMGIQVGFTSLAVILAQVFVAMPLYLRAARAGFENVDPVYEQVAATLGEPESGIFLHITVPLALPGLLAGAVLAWARALGEFGATLMFAGNFQGRTQTIPLAILQSMEVDLEITLLLSCLLVALSFLALLLLKAVTRRGLGGRAP